MAVSFLSRLFSARARLQATYEQGLAKAKARQLDAAVASYNSVITAKNVPADLKAMALLNRGIALAAQSNFDASQKDLEMVLKMDDAPSPVLVAAKEKLSRVKRRIP